MEKLKEIKCRGIFIEVVCPVAIAILLANTIMYFCFPH